MKRAILLTLAAGVATLPALWGVTGNTTFGQSVPAAIPSGASIAPSIDDSRTSTPTASGTVDDRGRGGKGADDSATTSSGPTSAASSDDRRGRSSDDATSSTRTTSSKATIAATVDDKGGTTGSGDDSGGHGGNGGSGKG